MRVVPDANILFRKYRLDTAELLLLARATRRLDHSLLVPAVVLDELVGQWRKEMASAISARKESDQTLARLTGGQLAPIAGEYNLDTLASGYREWLETTLRERFGATVLPYPSVSHADLTAWAISRRRPFKEIGPQKKRQVTGYRDALIWASVVEALAESESPIALISHDRSAFGADEGSNLHEDLLGELRALGRAASVVWFNGLRDFLAQEVEPVLERLDALLTELQAGSHGYQQNVEDALQARLLGLRGLNAEHLATRGIPIEGFYPEVVRIEPCGAWEFTDATALEDGKHFIKARRDVVIHYQATDQRPEDRDDWTEMSLSAPASAELACFLDPETGDVDTSAVSFRSVPAPPQVELSQLAARAREGDLDAARRIVELVRLHPEDSDLVLDGLPHVRGVVLSEVVSPGTDVAAFLVRRLQRTLSADDTWGHRDFNYANDVLGWLLELLKAALAAENHALAALAADTLFDLEPDWQRFALRNRTRPWLMTLEGDDARLIAGALARHADEVSWLRAEGWEPPGGAPEMRAALGLEPS